MARDSLHRDCRDGQEPFVHGNRSKGSILWLCAVAAALLWILHGQMLLCIEQVLLAGLRSTLSVSGFLWRCNEAVESADEGLVPPAARLDHFTKRQKAVLWKKTHSGVTNHTYNIASTVSSIPTEL
ncbi:hypothetical protein K470DRAFT_263958 [Piedraia hortae CBS 480.64]|uniref:Uncharacterized protein n=1 Tax=Piedraia hortae CBS 480.64 TaxID=1314780 RepID=A0A6A7C348_9PEZI|nr:hypothetical protein K470DRAFT_263958 [Piedraia hortae CBS 480.64]